MKSLKITKIQALRILAGATLAVIVNIAANAQDKISGDTKPGKKLSLDYKCNANMPAVNSKSALLPNGDLLLGICDKFFRINSRNKIVWQQDVGHFGEFVYIPATNRVYVTTGGSTIYTFNAANGKQLNVFAQNGSAIFKNLQPFGRDGFLYVSSAEEYRPRIPDMADELNYWGEKTSDWTMQIPPDAQIVVQGQRIFAVSTSADGVFTKELKIPRKK